MLCKALLLLLLFLFPWLIAFFSSCFVSLFVFIVVLVGAYCYLVVGASLGCLVYFRTDLVISLHAYMPLFHVHVHMHIRVFCHDHIHLDLQCSIHLISKNVIFVSSYS